MTETAAQILDRIGALFHVSVEEIRSDRKTHAIILARCAAMRELHKSKPWMGPSWVAKEVNVTWAAAGKHINRQCHCDRRRASALRIPPQRREEEAYAVTD